MELKELISKILEKSELEEEEIKKRINDKQEELGGLITPEGASHIVANELGINLFEGVVSKIPELKIENVIPGMSSIDIVGRVIRAFEPREFDRKDGAKGKVCSIILADETAEIRVVFWGKDADLIEEGKIQEGSIIKIMEGYTKENLNAEAEIHIGNRTRVVIDPKDIEMEISLPEDMQKKIAELEDGMTSVDVVGKVLRVYDPREFDREEGTKGKVVNIHIGDETGKARVVLWDEDVGLVEKGEIKENDIIKVKKGYVRIKFDEPDINIGKYGKLIINPSNVEIGEIPDLYDIGISPKNIAELEDGMTSVDVVGKVLRVYDPREFDREEGKKGKVANIHIGDETGKARVVLWDEDVGLVEKGEIKENDIIKVKRGYVRIKFDEPDINIGKYGKLILNPSNVEIGEIPDFYSIGSSSKNIVELEDGDRAEIRGALVDLYESTPVFKKEDGHGLVVSGVLDDGTANIRVVFFNKMAETLLNTPMEKVVESSDPLEILLEKKKSLLGKELKVIGNVKHKEQFDRLELFVNDIDLNPDPIAEGKKLLNKLEAGE